MYYDVNRILVDNKCNGQKWYCGIECELTPQEDKLIVFDVNSKTWKYQSLSGWNSYLVSIGNLKLSPLQKLDSNDKIVNKTNQELYSQGIITKDEYVVTQTQIINSNFNYECSEVGVQFEGYYFQYDDLSQNRLLKFKDITEVNFWRSVDNINVTMNNQQKNNLYSLLLLTWAIKFAEKSQEIDSL